MRKRLWGLILSLCIILTLIGCTSEGNKEDGSTTPPTNQTEQGEQEKKDDGKDEPPYTITVGYPVYTAAQPDLQKVFDRVNEVTLEKINAKIELKVVPVSQIASVYSVAISSGEKLDLIMMVPGSQFLISYATSNMIKPIDDEVEQYGQDIKAGLAHILETARYNGKLYGIPAKEIMVNGKGVEMLKSIVDKYGIDISKIKTYKDLDEVFEIVKKNEPDMYVFWPQSLSYYFLNYEGFGNNYGVLKNGGVDDLKLINMYEDPDYIEAVKTMREWYEKGYIPKDIATMQEHPKSLQSAGKLFAIQNPYNSLVTILGEKPPKTAVCLIEPVETTSVYQTFIWAVPVTCEKPEKPIQFLNLAYQDVELATLMRYGIEGEHYDVVSEGVIDNTKGAQNFIQYWSIWGDTAKLPVLNSALNGAAEGSIEKYWSLIEEWRQRTKRSKAFGFTFDPTPVKTEISALDAIMEKYRALEVGALDPDEVLTKMNEELQKAGLQKVIDEKQRQLDEWLKSQQ